MERNSWSLDHSDELYAEALAIIARKDAEIERLKEDIFLLRWRVDIMKSLLIRAADALESTRPVPEFPKLIQELRQSAY